MIFCFCVVQRTMLWGIIAYICRKSTPLLQNSHTVYFPDNVGLYCHFEGQLNVEGELETKKETKVPFFIFCVLVTLVVFDTLYYRGE